jgi:hypothetical protein
MGHVGCTAMDSLGRASGMGFPSWGPATSCTWGRFCHPTWRTMLDEEHWPAPCRVCSADTGDNLLLNAVGAQRPTHLQGQRRQRLQDEECSHAPVVCGRCADAGPFRHASSHR